MKILYFDTETTGTDARLNGMVQISGMIEIDGEVKETFNMTARPREKDIIEPTALIVIKKTKEELMTYPEPDTVHRELTKLFNKYIDKFDRNDKFIPAGYNVRFDIDFLNNFFLKAGDSYFGSYVAWQGIDILALIYYMRMLGAIDLPNYKLETVCKHYEIPLQAHDALADIKATREVLNKIKTMLTITNSGNAQLSII